MMPRWGEAPPKASSEPSPEEIADGFLKRLPASSRLLIALSGGGGSSAMPHKQNPVHAESLVAIARFNATQVAGMHHALVHEQERSGAAWALEWMILPQMTVATGAALRLADELLGSIERIGVAE